ncbi:MAG: hypothetical protein AAF292_13915 [Pseudomonadota bacterium]
MTVLRPKFVILPIALFVVGCATTEVPLEDDWFSVSEAQAAISNAGITPGDPKYDCVLTAFAAENADEYTVTKYSLRSISTGVAISGLSVDSPEIVSRRQNVAANHLAEVQKTCSEGS